MSKKPKVAQVTTTRLGPYPLGPWAMWLHHAAFNEDSPARQALESAVLMADSQQSLPPMRPIQDLRASLSIVPVEPPDFRLDSVDKIRTWALWAVQFSRDALPPVPINGLRMLDPAPLRWCMVNCLDTACIALAVQGYVHDAALDTDDYRLSKAKMEGALKRLLSLLPVEGVRGRDAADDAIRADLLANSYEEEDMDILATLAETPGQGYLLKEIVGNSNENERRAKRARLLRLQGRGWVKQSAPRKPWFITETGLQAWTMVRDGLTQQGL